MRRGAVRVAAACALVGAGLMGTPGARAATPVGVGPPYAASTDHAFCDPDGSEHCSAVASADAATGDIDLDTAVALPGGTDQGAWGLAKGAVRDDLELTEPAAGVVVRATFHIDHAELGFSGEGDPLVWAQASLWADVDVSHQDPAACEACEESQASTYFRVAFDDEYVEIDDETVVVEARLENLDGDVPAGTLDLEGSLQADSFLWHDEAATVVANADATLTGFEVVVVPADPNRIEDKEYIGPGGDVFYAYGTGPNCTTSGIEVGGVCFRLDPDDEMMRFDLSDDRTDGPIGGRWQAYDDDEVLLGAGDFCGTSDRVWIPDGATNVTVFTRTATSHLDCTDPTPATTGTATATFWG